MKCLFNVSQLQVNVETRCSPNRLRVLISKLNDLQTSAIREIGLGSLLELTRVDKITVSRLVVSELVDRFDSQTLCINVHGTQIKVSLEDVNYILGLRIDGREININGASEFGSLDVSSLEEELPSLIDGGDEFRVKFALFSLGCFLCPNSTLKINQGLIDALRDANSLKDVNWGKLVFVRLIEGLKKYRKKDGEDPKGYIFGCTYLLEVINDFTSQFFL